jgi:hypothetical protein
MAPFRQVFCTLAEMCTIGCGLFPKSRGEAIGKYNALKGTEFSIVTDKVFPITDEPRQFQATRVPIRATAL